jgi:hypothetical protein
MPVRTRWHDEKQNIFITEVEGEWTLDEFYSFFMKTEELIKTIPHPVVIVSDLSKSGRAPKQFLSAGRFMSKRRIPNVRMTITVGVSRFGQALIGIMAKAYPSARKTVLASTLDEAIRMAQEALKQADQPAP